MIAQHGEPEKWQKVSVTESKSKPLSQRSAWLAEEEGVGRGSGGLRRKGNRHSSTAWVAS